MKKIEKNCSPGNHLAAFLGHFRVENDANANSGCAACDGDADGCGTKITKGYIADSMHNSCGKLMWSEFRIFWPQFVIV